MIKNNRNNEQIYGRNDMIMLDSNNKIYGSLGLADNYVMKTEEGTKLTLSNPKLGSFDDVLTEFNIYGMSKQESTTGANLIDIDNMLNECLVKNVDDTWGGKNVGCAMSSDIHNNYAILSVPTNMLEDISSDENACASLVKICENTNAIFFYSMASPIETDLTPEEIEQYKKLRTKAPTTIIENNYDAWMKATYKSTESV